MLKSLKLEGVGPVPGLTAEFGSPLKLRKESPTDRLILLVAKLESHLHPKWQRVILPA